MVGMEPALAMFGVLQAFVGELVSWWRGMVWRKDQEEASGGAWCRVCGPG